MVFGLRSQNENHVSSNFPTVLPEFHTARQQLVVERNKRIFRGHPTAHPGKVLPDRDKRVGDFDTEKYFATEVPKRLHRSGFHEISGTYLIQGIRERDRR